MIVGGIAGRRRAPSARVDSEVAAHGVDRIGNVLVGFVVDGDLRPEREDRDQRGRAEPLPEMRVDMPGLPARPSASPPMPPRATLVPVGVTARFQAIKRPELRDPRYVEL